MTLVRMTEVPGYYHLRIEGHAGYGADHQLPEGHDIVCAAASMLGQTAVQRVLDMAEEGKLGIHEMVVKPGLIDIKVIPKGAYKEEIKTTAKTVRTGFELLAKAYPSYVFLGWEI